MIYELVQVLNKLDSHKRQIRSMRGLILYTLEIMKKNDNCQILETNLEPFFWDDVERIISQNKKRGLQNFLFSKETSNLTKEIKSLKKEEKYVYECLQKIISEWKTEILKPTEGDKT